MLFVTDSHLYLVFITLFSNKCPLTYRELIFNFPLYLTFTVESGQFYKAKLHAKVCTFSKEFFSKEGTSSPITGSHNLYDIFVYLVSQCHYLNVVYIACDASNIIHFRNSTHFSRNKVPFVYSLTLIFENILKHTKSI